VSFSGCSARGRPTSARPAFELGAAYATAQRGTTLSPFKFGDWLGSDRPVLGAAFPKRTSPSDATYTPPPVTPPKPKLTAKDIEAAEARGYTRKVAE
jgi:hypothetical protein